LEGEFLPFSNHLIKTSKAISSRSNPIKKHPDLLDEFPLYWTPKPNFKIAWRLDNLALADQEVCKFFSSLPVAFDTAYLLANEFDLGSLKSYTGTLFSSNLRE